MDTSMIYERDTNTFRCFLDAQFFCFCMCILIEMSIEYAPIYSINKYFEYNLFLLVTHALHSTNKNNEFIH